MASDGGSDEGGVLQPGASSSKAMCLGFHPHEELGGAVEVFEAMSLRRVPLGGLQFGWYIAR